MVDVGSQVSHCWSGNVQISKGRGTKHPYGNEEKLEISVRTHV